MSENSIEELQYKYEKALNDLIKCEKEKKIRELENELELSKLKEIKEDLNLYKKFVSRKGLKSEFQSFMIIELTRK